MKTVRSNPLLSRRLGGKSGWLVSTFAAAIALVACDNGHHELADDTPDGEGPSDAEGRGDARASHDGGPEKDGSPKEAGPHRDGSADANEPSDAQDEGDAEPPEDALEEADGETLLLPPRPIAPLSTARVTSRRPVLRWELPDGVGSATLDLCTDRACTQRIGDAVHADGSYKPATDLPVGVVFWRLHPGADTSVTSATWEFTVGAASAAVNTSWGTTLDVNGDGFADVAVGDEVGNVYLYLGSADGVSTTPSATLVGPSGSTSAFGNSVASAGDVNGDGYADLIVGARSFASNKGAAYLYLGGRDGIPSTKTPVTLVSPDLPQSLFGSFVSSAGDVNGDGYADVFIGAAEGEMTGAIGSSYLYLGGAGGLRTMPSKTFAVGSFVASAGDFNGDGFGDVVVATQSAATVYVYKGSASGLVAAPSLTHGSGAGFGTHVANAGDVNGDGYADLVVGAPQAGSGMAGVAYLYFGGASGYGAPLALNDPGGGESDDAFGTVVGNAGDWNGDGFADFAVESLVSGGTGQGTVFVYSGSATFDATSVPTPVLDSVQSNDYGFGDSISAGDVDNSGLSTLLVGSYYVDSAFLITDTQSSVTLTAPTGSFGISVFSAN